MPDKINLLLQGPMISVHRKDGRWGEFANEFSCEKAIIEMVDQYTAVLDRVVVSTWVGEENESAANRVKEALGDKVKFVFSPDPGRPVDMEGRVYDNRERMFFSTIKGLEVLKNQLSDEDWILKLRTDNTIDLALAREEITTRVAGNYEQCGQLGFLYVLNVFVKQPYGIDDTGLAGHFKDVCDFFDAQLQEARLPGAVSNIHQDIVLRFMFHTWCKRMSIPAAKALPLLPSASSGRSAFRLPGEVLTNWALFFNTSMRPLTRKLHLTLTWRGVPRIKYEELDNAAGKGFPLYHAENYKEIHSNEDLALMFGEGSGVTFSKRQSYAGLRNWTVYALEILTMSRKRGVTPIIKLIRLGRRVINKIAGV